MFKGYQAFKICATKKVSLNSSECYVKDKDKFCTAPVL